MKTKRTRTAYEPPVTPNTLKAATKRLFGAAIKMSQACDVWKYWDELTRAVAAYRNAGGK